MEKLVVDERGGFVPAPDGTVVGRRTPPVTRMVWASFPGRYQPAHSPTEDCLFGMDFSFVLPAGVLVTQAELAVFANTFAAPPAPEWTVGPVMILGTVVYARLTGGTAGTDYKIVWTITDSDGNVFQRTSFVLCSSAS